MEAIYVLTHLIMISCFTSILFISIAPNNNAESEIEKSIDQVTNPKPLRWPIITFYKKASGYLAALLSIISINF